MSRLCFMGLITDHDVATHGCNYWMCYGIIEQQQQLGDEGEEGAWLTADALHHEEIALDVDYYLYHQHHRQFLPASLGRCAESLATTMPCWSSPAYGFLLPPSGGGRGTFQHFDDRLCVLKLSRCTFSFSSPTFLSCRSLRFLWLDNCHDDDDDHVITGEEGAAAEEEEEEEEATRRRCFFGRLWVLDLRYTRCDRILSARMLQIMTQLRELNVMGAQEDWDMGWLQGPLSPNIRKLRVTKSRIRRPSSQDACLSLLGMNKMELLDFSGNHIITSSGITGRRSSLVLTNSSSLETVIMTGGCVGLEEISLRGCAKLKNIVLGGSFEELCNLDISGTAVKMLDLSSMSATKKLDELLLLDCDKLRAILWPSEGERKDSSHELFALFEGSSEKMEEERKEYLIKLRTILRPLEDERTYLSEFQKVFALFEGSSGKKEDEKKEHLSKLGIDKLRIDTTTKQQSGSSSISSQVVVVLPGARPPLQFDWYICVKDARLLRSLAPLGKYFGSHSVHMDISSSAHGGIPAGGCAATDVWGSGHSRNGGVSSSRIVDKQKQQGASTGGELLQQHNADDASLTTTTAEVYIGVSAAIKDHPLLLLPLLSSCPTAPSLSSTSCYMHIQDRQPQQAVMTRKDNKSPTPVQMTVAGASSTTIPDYISNRAWILHVHDSLSIASIPGPTRWSNQQQITIEFPNLKRIHLQELPRLQSICGGHAKMFAPTLESIKVRGCWSLKRLPDFRGDKLVECDCEKEWWDGLQWDVQAYQYKPRHSRYYKKPTLLRGTVLR